MGETILVAQKYCRAIGAGLLLSLLAGTAWGWSNHTYGAYYAFEVMPEAKNADSLSAESLDDFLKAEEKGLEQLLIDVETWAGQNIADYPKRPDKLAFKADPSMDNVQRKEKFLNALRIAPNTKFALYYQPHPGDKNPAGQPLKQSDVDTLPEAPFSLYRFFEVKPGEKISALKVIASASDEPDYGTDIKLWSDSESPWAGDYGFPVQPFGNPKLTYSSQAPFHMAFYYQSPVLYKAAPFIQHTYPILRVHQFSALSIYAFETGHDYWGWRFAGNALHYVQDLTQPYHASLLPGISTARILWMEVLAKAGMPQSKNDMVTLVSNRHLAVEKYQMQLLHLAAWKGTQSPVIDALGQLSHDGNYPAWNDKSAKDLVAKEAFDMGDRLDQALANNIPGKFVSDPTYDFGATTENINLATEMDKVDQTKRLEFDQTVAELSSHFGSHSRNLVRYILKVGKSGS